MDQDPEGIYQQGTEAEKSRDYDRAEGLYLRFRSLAPDDARGPNKLGVICALRRDLDGAEKYFQEALRIDSRNVAAITNIANLLLERGQAQEAIQHYEEALHWDPDYLPAHRNIAAALKKERRISEMVQHLKYAQRHARQEERRNIQKEVRQGCGNRGKTTMILLLAVGVLQFGVHWL